MLTLSQATTKTKRHVQLLPDLFTTLARDGIRFRRGQVTMIAGQPNSGKSLLALFYALKAGIPALYISADTDSYTTAIRAAASITGHTIQTVEEAFNSGGGYEFYLEEIASVGNVQFSFDPSPSLDDIDLAVKAYGESFGEYPHLIIVDNLMNVAAMHNDEWTGMKDIMKAMHHLARETDASVFILHHTSEADGRPEIPSARKSIQGKVSQLPEMILTVAIDHASGEFRVACVKNRFAQHDPSGNTYTTLHADASRMTLFENKISAIATEYRRGA